MKEIQQFLTHCSGFYNFINWLHEQQRTGFAFEVTNNIIHLNPLYSQYISLGISTLKRSNGDAFIAVPPREAKWLGMIQWNEIILRRKDNYIYFLSHGVKSPMSKYPDIPGLTIGFYVDLKEKTELLYSLSEILVREYRLEDDGGVYINYHKPTCKLPIRIISENEEIKTISNVNSYDDFLDSHYSAMLSAGNRFNPYHITK